MWRFNESPLVDGDKVICTPGGQDAMLVALDKLTGKTIWKSQMPSSTASGPGGAGAPGGPGRSRCSWRSRLGPGGPGSPGGGSAAAVTGTKDPGLFTGEH